MDASPAVAHALGILGALAAGAGPQSAAALGRGLSIPRSTTYRILATMADAGYAVHVPGAGYSLGPAAHELAWAYQRQAPLQRVAGPLLSALADKVDAAIAAVLASGLRTADIMQTGMARVGTGVMGEALLRELDKLAA